MATGWESMLPETAKAISAPVTKLIEVVAAGCGRLHAPSHLRKMAEAEGEALVIMEEAKQRASAIAIRAAQRTLDLETRRQENIEAILEKAQHQLPNEVAATPVHPDWATRVMQICQDISDDEMQALWAKLLAGEVTQPGSFSLRTIQVLAQLSKNEALAFEAMCAQAPTVGGQHVPLIFSTDSESLQVAGLENIHVLTSLVEAGLMDRAEMGRRWARSQGEPVILEFGTHERMQVVNEKIEEFLALLEPGHVPAGIYGLTGAGRQLARLVISAPSPACAEHFAKVFTTEGMTVTRESLRAT